MFWRATNFTTSAVEAILDKPDFTLEDLLEEDELIQECKALNARLVDFLKRPENVAKLLEYVTQPAPRSAEDKRQFKYPFSSCEVLCCEIDAVFTTLLGNPELLGALFGLLQQPRPLECLLAGYFARVLVCLLMRRAQDLLGYLKANQQHLSQLVDRMDNTSIAEALAHTVGADELSASFMASEDLAWLRDTPVLQELLDTLQREAAGPARENSAIVLSAIARSHTCPLTHPLGSAKFLDQLLSRASVGDGSGADVAQALDVPISLLERRSTLEAAHAHYPSESGPTEADMLVESQTAAAVAAHAGKLSLMLEPDAAAASQPTPFGRLEPPLGLARVKVAELFAALLGVGNTDAGSAVAAAGVLQRSLALVLRFPFNNILHAQATRMLLATLEYGNEELLCHLFRDCEVIEWLVSAPKMIPGQPRGGVTHPGTLNAGDTAEGASPPAADATADKAEENAQSAEAGNHQRPPLRAGYLGHLTLIANRMEATATRRDIVRSYLEASSAWREYSAGSLQERNSLEDPGGWACGRPDLQSLQATLSLDNTDGDIAAAFPEEQPGANSDPSSNPMTCYSGEGEAFGDVEEDDGASGNPGTFTLGDANGSGVIDSMDDGAVLIDAVAALHAMRLGSGAQGRSPTLAGQGGRFTTLATLTSSPPTLQREVPNDWEDIDPECLLSDLDGPLAAAASQLPPLTKLPSYSLSSSSSSSSSDDLSDAVSTGQPLDLFRSPRSKGGFGSLDDDSPPSPVNVGFHMSRSSGSGSLSPSSPTQILQTPPESPAPLPTLQLPEAGLPPLHAPAPRVGSFTRTVRPQPGAAPAAAAPAAALGEPSISAAAAVATAGDGWDGSTSQKQQQQLLQPPKSPSGRRSSSPPPSPLGRRSLSPPSSPAGISPRRRLPGSALSAALAANAAQHLPPAVSAAAAHLAQAAGVPVDAPAVMPPEGAVLPPSPATRSPRSLLSPRHPGSPLVGSPRGYSPRHMSPRCSSGDYSGPGVPSYQPPRQGFFGGSASAAAEAAASAAAAAAEAVRRVDASRVSSGAATGGHISSATAGANGADTTPPPLPPLAADGWADFSGSVSTAAEGTDAADRSAEGHSGGKASEGDVADHGAGNGADNHSGNTASGSELADHNTANSRTQPVTTEDATSRSIDSGSGSGKNPTLAADPVASRGRPAFAEVVGMVAEADAASPPPRTENACSAEEGAANGDKLPPKRARSLRAHNPWLSDDRAPSDTDSDPEG